MTETRREVFKLSVLSAFGMMAAGSVAKAADYKATRVIARTTQGGAEYDVLIDASSGRAWILPSLYYGKPLKDIPTGGLTPAHGTYDIANPASSTHPRFTCENGAVKGYYDIAANAWNEIGSRQNVVGKCSSVR